LQETRLMSVNELAKHLGVTSAWVYNNHRSLAIPSRKLGGHLRFRQCEVDRWIDRQCPVSV
jgi:excisionase family DNA binding protein